MPSSPMPKSSVPDRFIPSVDHMSFSLNAPVATDGYECTLKETLLENKDGKVLSYKEKAPVPVHALQNPHKVLFTAGKSQVQTVKKTARYIPSNPERILDAPGLLNDYYLNLIDWSSSNILALALKDTCYLWNAQTGSATQLTNVSENAANNVITSVQWTADGKFLSIGTDAGTVELWDAAEGKLKRTLKGHSGRVGALAWNGHLLATGSRDSMINQNDCRIKNHVTTTYAGHGQEVCGLKWSPEGRQLASGDNGNTVCVWNINQSDAAFTFNEHVAAVKALAWCPWESNLLASGGGSADRTIKFWNTNTGSLLNSIDTESQVSSLIWSPNSAHREIISSHGFMRNEINVWRYPSMTKVAELSSHEDRILNMCLSPDGTTVASASADESIRFWKVFDFAAQKSKPVVPQASSRVSELNLLR